MRTGQAESYVFVPCGPRERWLYLPVTDLLADWEASQRPAFEAVRIVGEEWERRSHELRNFFSRAGIPFGFYSPSSSVAAEIAERASPSAEARTVIVSTGVTWRRLEIPSLEALLGALRNAEGVTDDVPADVLYVMIGAHPHTDSPSSHTSGSPSWAKPDEFARPVPSTEQHQLTKEPEMRIVVNEFMSLDGVVQAPGGPEEDQDGGFAHGGWSGQYFDPDVMGAAITEGMNNADALLFGRRTWEKMAAAWPQRAGDPYADQMNAIKKYVVSRTLTEKDLTWNNTTLIPGDRALAEIAALREQDGGDVIIWGSASLVTTLLAEGLVDELVLLIEPILLGGGKRIFPEDGNARPLQLVNCVTAGTGAQICTYQPAS
jgi:dihydrofolate reductase